VGCDDGGGWGGVGGEQARRLASLHARHGWPLVRLLVTAALRCESGSAAEDAAWAEAVLRPALAAMRAAQVGPVQRCKSCES
jgi:hypothetical protein